MKKFFLSFILLPFAIQCHDTITKAIIKSDPELVKQEISLHIASGKAFTFEDKLRYIDFCEEVITRRRNAIQFPEYYNGSARPARAFPTDETKPLSKREVVLGLASSAGFILGIPIGLVIAYHMKPPLDTVVASAACGTGLISLIILCALACHKEDELKKSQEQLYENSIEIKHLFIHLQVTQ